MRQEDDAKRSFVNCVRLDKEREDGLDQGYLVMKGAGVASGKLNEEQKVRKRGVPGTQAINFGCYLPKKGEWIIMSSKTVHNVLFDSHS